jgi:uncharacterized damage-inducible protein DinB
MQHGNTLINANIQALTQGRELIEQLSEQRYSLAVRPLFTHGVGSHFRHCLDSYDCFLRGIETGRIDYGQRERDERVERDRQAAITRIEATIARLRNLTSSDETMSLTARQDLAVWSCTSIERELQFLLSHTVHHYALIALALRWQGFEPGEEFGVAPSTLQYWKEAA